MRKASGKHLRPHQPSKRHKTSTRITKLQERNDFERFLDESEEWIATPKEMLGISDDQVLKMFEEASLCLEMHEIQQAIRTFQILCSLCPYDPDCWMGLGKAMQEKGEFRQALSSFIMAETLSPSYFYAYEAALECCLEMNMFLEAKNILARCKKHRKECEEMQGEKSLKTEIERLEKEISIKEQMLKM